MALERTQAAGFAHRVGIIGAGQLARMLCESASELGLRTIVLAASPSDGACEVAGEVLIGSPHDQAAIEELAARCDVLSVDHEVVNRDVLASLAERGHSVHPSAEALRCAADKAHARRVLADAGIPQPRFLVLEAEPDADLLAFERFAEELGHVPVLKAATGGYDGRGVVIAERMEEAREALREWRASGTVVLAEQRVSFRTELAALLARSPKGVCASWRPVATTQHAGVCREILVPGPVDDRLALDAAALGEEVAATVGVVGMLAVELFDTDEGLFVNELATRPHNSGHWSIEGSVTSQFEQHLRAICDLPLGSSALSAPAIATVNVFGAQDPATPVDLAAALGVEGAHVHWYGKEPRPGRKLGHVTVCGERIEDVADRAWRAARALGTPSIERTSP